MYRVEFYCPRQAAYWQPVNETFFFLASATRKANSLIWQVHSARVLDSSGQVVYQV